MSKLGLQQFAASCLSLGGWALLVAHPAAAQGTWKPERPVEIVVTCQPGCGPDIAARHMQKIWQDHRIVAVPSVVVNKPGGGGSVAYGYLQQKPGDAHAMVLSGAGAIVNTIMGRGLGHRDVTPLALMAAEYVGVAVRTVVFQSGATAITALLGAHVHVVPASVGLWVQPVKIGQVRLLAVSSPQRLRGDMANVPTWREQGIDAAVSVWRMMMAAPGVTPARESLTGRMRSSERPRRLSGGASWKRTIRATSFSWAPSSRRRWIRCMLS